MVFVRFRDGLSATQRRALLESLGELRRTLSGILDFKIHQNVSTEMPLRRGFDDMFWFDFVNSAARDAYLVDDDHRALGARLMAAASGGIDGIFVCDIAL